MDGLQYPVSESRSSHSATVHSRDPKAFFVRGDASIDPALPVGGVWMQTVIRGEIRAPFGNRKARMDGRNLRLSVNRLAMPSVDRAKQAELLTVALPMNVIRPLLDYSRPAENLKTIDRIRLPVAATLGQILTQLKRGAIPGRATLIRDGAIVRSLVAGLEHELERTMSRLDRLPGRSLFKRADMFMRLEAANDHIVNHHADDPSTTLLAEISHISRAHFIRLFSGFYGISPKQLTLSLKLEESKRLIRETNLPVAQVATETGFGNRCAFQRLFKQRTGLTPLQYRRHCRSMVDLSTVQRSGVSLATRVPEWLRPDALILEQEPQATIPSKAGWHALASAARSEK